MKIIDKSKPVLVTGANGYVASWLVKKLLDEGLIVNATIRNPEDKIKNFHLYEMSNNYKGKLNFFKADLLSEGSYAEAMKNCELVFHTASPFKTNVKNPQKDLLDPAILGTINVLEQVNKTETVKRVVLTSSCAAIFTDCTDVQFTPNGILTEEHWNNTASLKYQPYFYSKTLAEKKAWEINKNQSRWDLITINPSFVIGPFLNTKFISTASFDIFQKIGDGSLKFGIPNLGTGLVDVRDVAIAHYNAGFIPEAEGRHIISGHCTNFLEMTKTLIPKYGKKYPIPKKVIPKWLLLIVGPFINKLLTKKFINNNFNQEWKADNSKSINKLNLKYISLQKSMEDTFQSLIDNGVIKKR